MAALALCEWGLHGVIALRDRVAVLVIVDVLSFSTAVDVAVSRGAIVSPVDPDRDAGAAPAGALWAGPRGSGFSLSPQSLAAIPPGTHLMLQSPNGARLSLACGSTLVFAGCLRNARAVAQAARRVAGDAAIGVVPAGESWPDGSLRPAIEDLFGAGAVLDHLDLPMSAEARVARDAFRAAGTELTDIVRDSISGRELIDREFAGDVALAVQHEISMSAPLLVGGAYRAPLPPLPLAGATPCIAPMRPHSSWRAPR